jgi:hypothetical protein
MPKTKKIIKYSIESAKDKITKLLKIVFTSTKKHDLINAMHDIYDFAMGDKIYGGIGFEDSRYLVTTRDLQKIKETHYGKSTWNYVKKHYEFLYVDLFKDLNPNDSVISNGNYEDGYTLIKTKT